jgi:hypothetical protein
MKAILALGIPLVTLWLSAASHAGLYRWVDENGITQYSQTPPPDGQADRLKPPPPPAEDPQAARRRLDQQLQQVDDRLEDRELAAQEKQRQDQERRARESNCQAARANLETLGGPTNRVMLMPDGSYKRLTEEERQKLMDEARQQISENCQ